MSSGTSAVMVSYTFRCAHDLPNLNTLIKHEYVIVSPSPRFNRRDPFKLQDSALARASCSGGWQAFLQPTSSRRASAPEPPSLASCSDQPHYHSPCIYLRLVCRRAVVEVKKQLRRENSSERDRFENTGEFRVRGCAVFGPRVERGKRRSDLEGTLGPGIWMEGKRLS